MEKKVSIIVPFYKTPRESFEKCIKSLKAQTYHNIEILVINDGSGSEWELMLEEILGDDEKVRLINRENNVGLSAVRNYGLDVCVGEDVIFVDSDDMLNENAIEAMIRLKEKTNSDIVIGELCITNSYDVDCSSKCTGYEVFETEQALEKLITNSGLGSTACGRLASKAIWEGQGKPFIEGILHEDLASTWEIINKCNRICWLKGDIYYYYQGGSSEIHSKKPTEKFCRDYIFALKRRNNGVLKYHENMHKPIAFSYLIYCPNIYMYADDLEDKEQSKCIKADLRKLYADNYREGVLYNCSNFKRRVKIRIFRYLPKFYCIIYKTIRRAKGLRN